MHKHFYLIIFVLISITQKANPPRYQYCLSYCTKEDTVFDDSHHPVYDNGAIRYQCVNIINEIRNGDCPPEMHDGLNTVISPTRCYRLKNYNGQSSQGDGTRSYKDFSGIDWVYFNVTRTGETDNPKALISYSKKTGEFCLEIPLLKYKIVLFSLEEHQVKEGYYERTQIDGNRLIMETIKVSRPDQPTNPVEVRLVYDFSFLFDEYRDNLIVTNPNPFDKEIKVRIAKEVLDSNSNLKLVLRDNSGKRIVELHVDAPITNISTLLVGKGKYVLFLMRNEDIMDFKQMFK